jgi:hypothetical protein
MTLDAAQPVRRSVLVQASQKDAFAAFTSRNGPLVESCVLDQSNAFAH